MIKQRIASIGLAFVLFTGFFLGVQSTEIPDKVSEVEFDMTGVTLQQLSALGVTVDHNDYMPGDKTMTLPISQWEIQVLRENNIPHRVLVDDFARYTEARLIREFAEQKENPSDGPAPPKYFKHGSMSGYLTFNEIVKELDEMRTRYPKLASAKFEIGKSVEGRPIWAIRLSNKPDVEQDKRRVVYNNLIHAREPMAVMSMTWFLWHLLETYSTNPTSQNCLDSVEVYYIPVVNPDGYEYNRSTNPRGGGLWRKNRSTNTGGTRGVDLNRNFSTNWGNNTGSSSNGSSYNYRGPRAFSEPEVRAVRDFYLKLKPLMTNNFHAYGNLLLRPWGLGGQPANVSVYTAAANVMNRTARYTYGDFTLLGYAGSGVEIDWSHEVVKALAWNEEIGLSSDGGFWPSTSLIDGLADRAMGIVMGMCTFTQTLPFTPTVSVSPTTPSGKSFYLNTTSNQWEFNYKISDPQSSWYLTLYDLKGKQHQKVALPTTSGAITLPQTDLNQSLYLLEVTSCKENGCQSIYQQKLVKSTY